MDLTNVNSDRSFSEKDLTENRRAFISWECNEQLRMEVTLTVESGTRRRRGRKRVREKENEWEHACTVLSARCNP